MSVKGGPRPKALPVSVSERTGTGLDYLRQIIAGEIANVPIGDHLGFRLVEVEPGRIVLAGTPDERSYNLIGTVHGGWTAAILDTTMALASVSLLDNESFTTLDFKINFLRPMTSATGEVRAEGKVVHGGRRVSLSEARLLDKDGKLIAHGTSTCLIVPK